MKVSINITDKDLLDMIKTAGLKVKSKAAFKKLIKTPKFKKDVAADILNVWQLQNEDGDGDFYDVVFDLFDGAVIDPDEDA